VTVRLSARADVHVSAERGRATDNTPRVLGCRIEFLGALNRKTIRARGPDLLSFTRLERINRSWSDDALSHVAVHKSNAIGINSFTPALNYFDSPRLERCPVRESSIARLISAPGKCPRGKASLRVAKFFFLGTARALVLRSVKTRCCTATPSGVGQSRRRRAASLTMI